MTGIINNVGAMCFGVATGYITYRTLVRTVGKTAVSDLAGVIAALGGAAVTKLFAPNTPSSAGIRLDSWSAWLSSSCCSSR